MSLNTVDLNSHSLLDYLLYSRKCLLDRLLGSDVHLIIANSSEQQSYIPTARRVNSSMPSVEVTSLQMNKINLSFNVPNIERRYHRNASLKYKSQIAFHNYKTTKNLRSGFRHNLYGHSYIRFCTSPDHSTVEPASTGSEVSTIYYQVGDLPTTEIQQQEKSNPLSRSKLITSIPPFSHASNDYKRVTLPNMKKREVDNRDVDADRHKHRASCKLNLISQSKSANLEHYQQPSIKSSTKCHLYRRCMSHEMHKNIPVNSSGSRYCVIERTPQQSKAQSDERAKQMAKKHKNVLTGNAGDSATNHQRDEIHLLNKIDHIPSREKQRKTFKKKRRKRRMMHVGSTVTSPKLINNILVEECEDRQFDCNSVTTENATESSSFQFIRDFSTRSNSQVIVWRTCSDVSVSSTLDKSRCQMQPKCTTLSARPSLKNIDQVIPKNNLNTNAKNLTTDSTIVVEKSNAKEDKTSNSNAKGINQTPSQYMKSKEMTNSTVNMQKTTVGESRSQALPPPAILKVNVCLI